MQENIGQEKDTRLFTVVFSPITAVPDVLNSDIFAVNDHTQPPVTPWTAEIGKAYFMCISHRTNGYFLSSIDFIDRWNEEQERKDYLASGQLQNDKPRADALQEEITSVNKALTQLLIELEPLNLPEEEYRARIAPLENRDKELRTELEEVWSHFKYIPYDAAIFGHPEPLSVNMNETTPENSGN